MADLSTLTPAGALSVIMDDMVADLQLKAAPTFQFLRQKGRIFPITKTQIDWVVDIGGGTYAVEAVTADDTALSTTDSVVPARLPVGSYRIKHKFSISLVEINDARTRAPGALQNLFASFLTRGINHVTRALNELIWIGDGTATDAEISGLSSVVTDPTATYATINPATVTNWVPVVDDNAGTPRALSRALLHSMDTQMRIAETSYDAIVMHPNMAERYMLLWQGVTLENSAINSVSQNASGMMRADLGMIYKSYNGVPIVEDPHCPDGNIFFMNCPDVYLWGMPLGSVPGRPDSQSLVNNTSLGIPMFIAELPSNNSSARKFELGVLPQLQVHNRKFVAAIKDLATS